MKSHFYYPILLFLLLPFWGLSQTGNAALYGQVVYVQPKAGALLQKAVDDLEGYLSKGTGKKFTSYAFTALKENGIYLVLNRPGLLPAALEKQLNNGPSEGFVIHGSPHRLLIVANLEVGLSHGVYTYLDHLGFKWYLPGDRWVVVPALNMIQQPGSRYHQPFFEYRDFSGTGSILFIPSLDPDSRLHEHWNDWKRRNRFGGAYQLAGHYGETFNLKHQKVLTERREWLAMVKGKREWGVTAKWCISNKAFREFFIADRLAELAQLMAADGDRRDKWVLTVDPADGEGHCECGNCTRMGSASYRVFFLANETAKALAKASPKAYANLYAYNQHAAPPAFPLAANLIVAIVPYAFQSVGAPAELISQWKARHKNLLIYDYYGIPDWHWDLPLSGNNWGIEAWIKRVLFWQAEGIKGFLYETSNSAISTGPGLYVSGRLGWDKTENTGRLLDQFYRQLFGDISVPVRQLFEKMQNDFQGASDLPYLLQLLNTATRNSKDQQVQQRLTVLQSYLNYLAFLYQHRARPDDEVLRQQLLNYTYGIYHLGTVHSTRIGELLLFNLPETHPLRQAWNPYAPTGPSLKKVTALSDKKIADLFQENVKKYPLLEDFDYTGHLKRQQFVLKSASPAIVPAKEGMMILNFPEAYVQPPASGEVTFLLKVNEGSANNASQVVPVKLVDTLTGKEVATDKIAIGKEWKTVRLKVPVGKTYRLEVMPQNWIRLSVPENQWMAFRSIPIYAVLGRLYFYVPEGFAYLYYSNTQANQPLFKNGKGEVVQVEKANDVNLYRLLLKSKAGGWFTMEGADYLTLDFFGKVLFFPHSNVSPKRMN